MKRLLTKLMSPGLLATLVFVVFYSGLAETVQANTKSDQRKVRKEIKQLNKQIGRKKEESSSISSQVTKLEKELGTLSGKKHDTEQKIKATQTRLIDTEAQRTELNADLKTQHGALAQQLQAMHTAGEQSHLRLLLLQDNPSEISRNVQYFNYLNQYRTKKITEISQISSKLEAVSSAAKKERSQLKGLEEELSRQKQQVEIKLASRESALKKVRSDLNSKQKRMRKLVSQEKALQKEIDRIARRAAKKRAQAAARKEAKRKAQQKQQRNAAKQRQQQKQAARTTNNRAQQKKQQPAGRKVTTSRTPNKPFSKLRGKLSWPVSGRVIHRYNSRRNEKQRWRGVVIAAPGGAKVRAVAPGRVVFAGWMNGYGHLIIIEHDRNYMSLYGYNRAVFKRVGQRVKANETIAAVGNSSGQSRNALYFEIRRKTVPQNPARWLR
ncbi:MAG: murein hydrolase activator EnvC family protein [Thiolinea sp.]